MKPTLLSLLRSTGWTEPSRCEGTVFRRGIETIFVYDENVLFATDDLNVESLGYKTFEEAMRLITPN